VVNSFLSAYRGVLIAPPRGYNGISGRRSVRGAQDEYNSNAGGFLPMTDGHIRGPEPK
jgi:hypothetical protein